MLEYTKEIGESSGSDVTGTFSFENRGHICWKIGHVIRQHMCQRKFHVHLSAKSIALQGYGCLLSSMILKIHGSKSIFSSICSNGMLENPNTRTFRIGSNCVLMYHIN